MDLRTQYSELTTLTTQYIKFITETLRRLEDEEVGSGAGRHGQLYNQKERSSRGLWPHHYHQPTAMTPALSLVVAHVHDSGPTTNARL